MNKAVLIARYKGEKGIIVYAIAQTKDDESAYFFKKENKDTNTNDWLKAIAIYAKSKNLNEIDQKKFLDQFKKFNEIGKIIYIHKYDNNIKFTILNKV